MAKANRKLVAPETVNRTVTPLRRKNVEVRTREYLTADEIERLLAVVKKNRYGQRDATMVLICYRHGLRVSELVNLKWSQVHFKGGRLHVNRVKSGSPAVHPLCGDELRALRQLRREHPTADFIFTSERGTPFAPTGFAKMVERAGVAAGIEFKAHPHMLRHACGHILANKGVDTRSLQVYLGHKNIQHTAALHRIVAEPVQGFLELKGVQP